MTDKTGGPAFPWMYIEGLRFMQNSADSDIHGGMTLRDYFAARALQGILSSYPNPGALSGPELDKYVIAAAYRIADAMLKERNR